MNFSIPIDSITSLRFHAVTISSCLLLSGCDPTEQKIEQVVDDTKLISSFLAANPEYESVFRNVPKKDKVPFLLDVYVDHSKSMRGYLEFRNEVSVKKADSNAEELVPQLFTLLRRFADQSELIGFNAFGTLGEDADSTQETVTPLGRIAPTIGKEYSRLNNDYAELIKLIQERPQQLDGKPVQHVIITDGVQSHRDPGKGSALSNTVKALQTWINKGGVVDIRLATSSFSGTYYSEELRALQKKKSSFEGSVKQRPFLIIGLLSGEEMLPSWQQFWDRSGLKAVEIKAQALFPDQESQSTQLHMELESKVSKVLAPEIRYSDVWELKPVETVDNMRNLFSAKIVQPRTKDNNNPETYPVSIRITGADDIEQIFKNSKPTINVWRFTKEFQTPTSAVSDKDARQTEPSPPVEITSWKELNEDQRKGLPSDVRAILSGTPKPLQNTDEEGKKLDDRSLRLLLRLPLQKRGEVADLMVLTVEEIPQDEKVPEAFINYSCLDDSSESSLDHIYNLQQLVEQFSRSIKPAAKKTGILVITHR